MARNSTSDRKVKRGSTRGTLTAERRSQIARKAAAARWEKEGKMQRLQLLSAWLGPMATLALRRDFGLDLTTI